MRQQTLEELGKVLIEAGTTGRPIEMKALTYCEDSCGWVLWNGDVFRPNRMAYRVQPSDIERLQLKADNNHLRHKLADISRQLDLAREEADRCLRQRNAEGGNYA